MLHHALCLRPGRPLKNARLIVVGSFRAGGAGKTPFCLWLARQLANGECSVSHKRIAILCHKYATDEVSLYKAELQDLIAQGLVQVFETANRYRAAHQLDSPEGDTHMTTPPDYILCDDGFEDSRLQPDITFRLDWEDPPTRTRQLIPAGKFRSLRQDHSFKFGQTIPLLCYGSAPHLTFRISDITSSIGQHLSKQQVTLVCGLGDPARFIRDIKNAGIDISKAIIRPDHDRKFCRTIRNILQENPQEHIIISEKDFYRLPQDLRMHPQVFIAKQAIDLSGKAIASIKDALAR